MRRLLWVILGLSALSAATLVGLIVWPVGREPEPIALDGNIDLGRYLARASGCIACHTDHVSGGAPLAGGAPLKTDFGIIHPPNLTTDPINGIGAWSIEDFAMAVRQGISPEGKPYYPAFTYPFYANFSDQDIADLWSAFQTVPPVAKTPSDHEMIFPFNQRWGLKLWRTAFLTDPETDPVPGKSESWNRGRWLVRGAAHCGACHTPRNAAGARILKRSFGGNDRLPGGGHAPSILTEVLAKKGWTIDGLAYSLLTGITPEGDVFGGTMAEVVSHGTSFLSQSDLRAMAIYILNDDGSDG